MPILGAEEKNQDRERARERIREHRPTTHAATLRGTVTELSGGGPDFAPYDADPEWDGLGKRVTPSTRSATTVVSAKTIEPAQWQSQLDGLIRKLKMMFGLK